MNELLTGVRHYAQLREAREAALALAAKDLAYRIDPAGDGWVLLVETSISATALRELAAYEQELLEVTAPPEPASGEPFRATPLVLPTLILCAFFLAQQRLGDAWTDVGVADGEAILQRGEWWRVVTALTLHGDLGHLLANLFTGLTFAAFLQSHFGNGLLWLLVLLSGAAGNLVNAWGYRGETHYSLGASTAVFGALGLLMACELLARWRSPIGRRAWQLIVPLGAGLALLAYLGVGEKHEPIDFMAHCWGLLCGLALGLAAEGILHGRRWPGATQWLAGAAVLATLGGAWWAALRAGVR